MWVCVNPSRTIDIEVADQLRVIGKWSNVLPPYVVAPILEFWGKEIWLPMLRVPMMEISEREHWSIGHSEPLVFFIGKKSRLTMIGSSVGSHVLVPTNAIESPRLEVGPDLFFKPALNAIAILSLPQVSRFSVP
jgi:hypothetical protein